MIHVDLSVLLPLRDAETVVAPLVRTAVEVANLALTPTNPELPPQQFEVLALDERSGDNTSSVLSVLHGQLPQLRTLQDLDRGLGLRTASRVARGEIWLILDRPILPDLAVWAVSQIVRGQSAAIIPGELLALHRTLGSHILTGLTGGLATAQQRTFAELRRRGQQPAFNPATDQGHVARAMVFLRGQAHRVGLAHLDRPALAKRSDLGTSLRDRASTLRNRLL